MKPFIELTIGGYKGDLPPDTEFLRLREDKQSGRQILYVPVILNERPSAGKPYTNHEGERVTPSIVGRTTIRECTIQMPGPLGVHCTLSGFCSIQIKGLTPEEVIERYEASERLSQSGTALVYDWDQHAYKVVVVDDTDDISTCGTFDSKPPEHERLSGQETERLMKAPPRGGNQSPSDHRDAIVPSPTPFSPLAL